VVYTVSSGECRQMLKIDVLTRGSCIELSNKYMVLLMIARY
jgi:hypothetical protein